MVDDRFAPIIERLASTSPSASAFNPYASYAVGEVERANSIRRSNLRLYLHQMASMRPKVLLVGEAPGFRGCRMTGVPFTSEFILLSGVTRVGLFGRERGYQKTAECKRVCREATATMVWEQLAHFWPPPLLWNAFPFHPHRVDEPLSNRAPTANELAMGRPFLCALIRLFPIEKVVAVGRKADFALYRAGITASQVRHPAHGGKAAFGIGLRAIGLEMGVSRQLTVYRGNCR